MTYKDQLQNNNWKKKSKEIRLRDNNQCQECGKTTTLQVHHKYYDFSKLAWEYPDDCYITLCNDCHADKHPEHPKLKKKVINRYLDNLNKDKFVLTNTSNNKNIPAYIAGIIKFQIVLSKVSDINCIGVDFEIDEERLELVDKEMINKIKDIIHTSIKDKLC
jgi:hypothetical protein